MKSKKLCRALNKAGFLVLVDEPLPNDLGSKIVLAGGGQLVVYRTGKLVIQGAPTAGQRARLEEFVASV